MGFILALASCTVSHYLLWNSSWKTKRLNESFYKVRKTILSFSYEGKAKSLNLEEFLNTTKDFSKQESIKFTGSCPSPIGYKLTEDTFLGKNLARIFIWNKGKDSHLCMLFNKCFLGCQGFLWWQIIKFRSLLQDQTWHGAYLWQTKPVNLFQWFLVGLLRTLTFQA